MARYIFDIETDGLLDELTRVHSLVLRDIDTGTVLSCHDHYPTERVLEGCPEQDTGPSIRFGLEELAAADLIVGHNIIRFDIPAIQKVYPWFKPRGVVRDTMVLSRLIWPEIKQNDLRFRKKNPQFPAKLIGKHSLDAWGHRLKNWKGDFKGPWEKWSEEMQRYCEQDVAVTASLWDRIVSKGYAEAAIDLEHRFAEIIALQERHGFHFDVPKAQALYAELAQRRLELEEELKKAFKPWYSPKGIFTPKVNNAASGYVAGAPFTKVKLNVFNPKSRDHIADRLMKVRGWKPREFTDTGKPAVDDDIIAALPYPEAPLIAEYLMVQKRIGQLAEGDKAWLKYEKNGRIHGAVNTNGAVTRRCTHEFPNIAQVPTNDVPYGRQCRDLFYAPDGYDLVGTDAASLELRCLAHYMARYDGGEYAQIVTEGDVHWVNAQALGVVGRDEVRDDNNDHHLWARNKVAKRFIYAFLYGCGDEKAGLLTGVTPEEAEEFRLNTSKYGKWWKRAVKVLQREGREPRPEDIAVLVKGALLKDRFLNKTPALKRLRNDVVEVVKERGFLKAIDGGVLHVRSAHSALNTLLQSAGAIAMKKALVILHDELTARGWVHGEDYAFVANIHDEIQAIVKKDRSKEYGELAASSIRIAGERLGFRCPLEGQSKYGRTWAETH